MRDAPAIRTGGQAAGLPTSFSFFFFLVKKKDIKNVRLKTKFFQNFLYFDVLFSFFQIINFYVLKLKSVNIKVLFRTEILTNLGVSVLID